MSPINSYIMLHRNENLFDKISSTECDESISELTTSDEIHLENERQECLMPSPNDDVLRHIVQQVESYFTDENLIRDEFIVKNIRRNKEGYVNITLIASLRRVKAITKFHPEPWRLIAYAIDMGSDKLEVNSDGTKIRRKVPLPPIVGSKYSRTVIIAGLPDEKANVDLIYNDFSTFGLIHSVRIFDSKTVFAKHNKFFKHLDGESLKIVKEQAFAIVEFNLQCDAQKCLLSHRTLIHLDPIWSDIKLYFFEE